MGAISIASEVPFAGVRKTNDVLNILPKVAAIIVIDAVPSAVAVLYEVAANDARPRRPRLRAPTVMFEMEKRCPVPTIEVAVVVRFTTTIEECIPFDKRESKKPCRKGAEKNADWGGDSAHACVCEIIFKCDCEGCEGE